MIATLLPAAQLCGLTNPVPNDGSLASIIGNIYPTTYMLLISRGVFNKGLWFADLVVPEGGKNFVALDMIVDRVRRHLAETRESNV